MKNQEKDLKNENTGRVEKHTQKFGEYMRMVEEERERAEQEKNQK